MGHSTPRRADGLRRSEVEPDIKARRTQTSETTVIYNPAGEEEKSSR